MIDWNRVSELREEVGDEDLQEILEMFLEEVAEVLDRLPAESHSALSETLHFLKGSAMNIGLSDFSALCRDLEAELALRQILTADLKRLKSSFAASADCIRSGA